MTGRNTARRTCDGQAGPVRRPGESCLQTVTGTEACLGKRGGGAAWAMTLWGRSSPRQAAPPTPCWQARTSPPRDDLDDRPGRGAPARAPMPPEPTSTTSLTRTGPARRGARRGPARAVVSEGTQVVQDAPAPTPAQLRVDFGAHLEANYRRLVAQLYAITLDPAEAHSAVQDAYSRAWRSWATVSRSPDPSAGSAEWPSAPPSAAGAGCGSGRADTVGPGQDTESAPCSRRCAGCPPPSVGASCCTTWPGAPVQEIAAVEGVSLGTTAARLARAQKVVSDGLARLPDLAVDWPADLAGGAFGSDEPSNGYDGWAPASDWDDHRPADERGGPAVTGAHSRLERRVPPAGRRAVRGRPVALRRRRDRPGGHPQPREHRRGHRRGLGRRARRGHRCRARRRPAGGRGRRPRVAPPTTDHHHDDHPAAPARSRRRRSCTTVAPAPSARTRVIVPTRAPPGRHPAPVEDPPVVETTEKPTKEGNPDPTTTKPSKKNKAPSSSRPRRTRRPRRRHASGQQHGQQLGATPPAGATGPTTLVKDVSASRGVMPNPASHASRSWPWAAIPSTARWCGASPPRRSAGPAARARPRPRTRRRRSPGRPARCARRCRGSGR